MKPIRLLVSVMNREIKLRQYTRDLIKAAQTSDVGAIAITITKIRRLMDGYDKATASEAEIKAVEELKPVFLRITKWLKARRKVLDKKLKLDREQTEALSEYLNVSAMG